MDMKQPPSGEMAEGGGDGEGASLLKKGEENWWSGMRRWHLGMVCEDAVIELENPEIMGD